MYGYEVSFWDEQGQRVAKLPTGWEDQLDKIKDFLEKCLEKLKDVKGYDLSSFELGLSLQAGIWIITAKGSITLKYSLSKASKES
jgi:hypothetical protein